MLYVASENFSFEGQKHIAVHYNEEIFWIKNNRHRGVFARRHLEAGQYVAQSGLHLHQFEPHSCEYSQEIRC